MELRLSLAKVTLVKMHGTTTKIKKTQLSLIYNNMLSTIVSDIRVVSVRTYFYVIQLLLQLLFVFKLSFVVVKSFNFFNL